MIEEAQHHAEAVGSLSPESHIFDEQELTIDYVKLIRTLRSGVRTIFLIVICASVLAVAVSFLIPPEYTSNASFLPPGSNNVSGAAALAGQLSQLPGFGASSLLGGVKSPGDLYEGLLKSQSIADELIDKFDLKRIYKVKKESQAAKLLAENTRIDVGVKDSIVTLSVTDKDPDRARKLATAYLDALHEINDRLALTESSQRRFFFGQQLAKEKDSLADAEVELKKAEEQSGLIAPAGQTQIELQTIAATRAQIAARQVQLSALRQSATEENPNVVRLKSEIADLQSQLSRLEGDGHDPAEGIPTSKIPQLGLEIVRKERDVKYHETLFDMLARQYESARIDEAHDAPLLQVIDPASYPDTKSAPIRGLFLAGGVIVGLFVGCGWVLLKK